MSFPRMSPYPQQGPITIANGEELPVPKGGSFIRVRDADQKFRILLDDDAELIAELNDVFRLNGADKFKKITIINDSGFPLTFQLEIGDGSIETNKLSIVDDVSIKNANAPNDILATKPIRASTLNTPAAKNVVHNAAAMTIVAANAARVSVMVRNLSLAYTIYIGGADVDASANPPVGFPIAPGEAIPIGNESGGYDGAVYAHNTSGQDVLLAVMETLE